MIIIEKHPDILRILSLPPKGVLSLTGAGGKTSILFHLAKLLSGKGFRVLTTTTTKIFYPTIDQSRNVIVTESIPFLLDKAGGDFSKVTHITAVSFHIEEKNKLKGFSPKEIEAIRQAGIFDWILVEADGARRCSLKAPAEHEPVVPPYTDVWIGVVGLDVVGKALSEKIAFRPERVADIVGIPLGTRIEPAHIAVLTVHSQGGLKGVPEPSRKYVFLNKADRHEDVINGRKIVEDIRAKKTASLDGVIIGQAKDALDVKDFFDFRTKR